jgi:hypothetical protein
MSDTQKAATPHSVLVAQLLDLNKPKTEREHAAVRELTAAIARAEAAEATVERCKQVCYATAEGWRETQAELDRLTTLRPASEHDGETRVYWHMRNGRGEWSAVGPYVSATGTHFTPLPDVKEATK